MAGPRHRFVLFCCASAALAVAALLLGHGSSSTSPGGHVRTDSSVAVDGVGGSSSAGQPRSEDASPRSPTVEALSAERSAVRSAARGFLAAFFRYEHGELSASARRRLREYATSAFAEVLLAAPPRQTATASFPSPARLASLEVTFLGTASPPSALVQGTAIRAGRVEPLSFRFERGARGWLAAGLGQ